MLACEAVGARGAIGRILDDDLLTAFGYPTREIRGRALRILQDADVEARWQFEKRAEAR